MLLVRTLNIGYVLRSKLRVNDFSHILIFLVFHCLFKWIGTAAGTTFGVAKRASIIPVKVLGDDGSGTISGVISGVDWVANQHKQSSGKKSVANLSLVGGSSGSLNTAVNRAASDGVVMVVAAGNDEVNACNYSPAGASSAITVGSTDPTDRRSSFSNHGSCLDIFAPGRGITGAWIGSDSRTNIISGTSMASPREF